MSRVRPWSLRNAGLPPRPAWAPEPVCRRPSSMAGLDCFAGAGGAPRHGPRRATLTLTRHRAATPPSVIQSICIAHAASDGCRRPGVDGISNTVHPLRPDEERCLRLTARLAGAPPSSGRLPLPSPLPSLPPSLASTSAVTLLQLCCGCAFPSHPMHLDLQLYAGRRSGDEAPSCSVRLLKKN
ncbi:hypothetical protein PVAP13_8NG324584 [Panicum virgatum]|uniref:Uncharacterized protein n=1 Tax=Panicum virgatum TaxID=38727 RepID=A0A8T0PFV0_PANVG|nr:hypothetical protein PVAP13_8NG324584 [Panicum virgatum]